MANHNVSCDDMPWLQPKSKIWVHFSLLKRHAKPKYEYDVEVIDFWGCLEIATIPRKNQILSF